MFALLFSFTNYSISQDLDDTSLTPPIPILDHVQILREWVPHPSDSQLREFYIQVDISVPKVCQEVHG